MFRSLSAVAYAMALTTLYATANADGTATLRYSPKVGASFTQTMTSKINMIQKMAGNEQVMDQDIEVAMTSKVLSNEAGKTVVESRYKHLRQASNMTQGGMSMGGQILDTREKDGGPADLLAGMMDQPIQLTVLPNGAIDGVTGVDGIIEGILATQEDKSFADQQRTMLESVFTGEQIGIMLHGMTIKYPDRALAVGDTWTEASANSSFNFLLNISTVYRVASIADGKVTLEFTSDIKSDPEPMDQGPGVTVSINLTGKQNGTVIVHQDSGITDSSTGKMELAGNLNVDQLGQKMDIGMDLKNDFTTRNVMN